MNQDRVKKYIIESLRYILKQLEDESIPYELQSGVVTMACAMIKSMDEKLNGDKDIRIFKSPRKSTFSKEEEDSICFMYECNFKIKEIASKYGISEATVLNIIKRNDVKLRLGRRIPSEKREEVVSLYKDGVTIDDIIDKTGIISEQTIYRILNEAGFYKKRNNMISEDAERQIVNLYNEGKTLKDICKITGVKNIHTLYPILKKHNVVSRRTGVLFSDKDPE